MKTLFKTNILKMAGLALVLTVAAAANLKAAWERSTLSENLPEGSTQLPGPGGQPSMMTRSFGMMGMNAGMPEGQAGGAQTSGEIRIITTGTELMGIKGAGAGFMPAAAPMSMNTVMSMALGTEGGEAPMGTMALGAAPALPVSAPEIVSIAKALDYDAGRILDWVKLYVEYEPYNGVKRGAKLTALERAGNSFDIAALTVALLRASGLDARYTFVNRWTDVYEASNWLGVAPDRVFNYMLPTTTTGAR